VGNKVWASRGGPGSAALPVAALRVAPLRQARHGCGAGSVPRVEGIPKATYQNYSAG